MFVYNITFSSKRKILSWWEQMKDRNKIKTIIDKNLSENKDKHMTILCSNVGLKGKFSKEVIKTSN